MKKMLYFVNKRAQANGDHEVHRSDCEWLPGAPNRQYLGDFASCAPAVAEAKRYFPQSNGCVHCSPACHTG